MLEYDWLNLHPAALSCNILARVLKALGAKFLQVYKNKFYNCFCACLLRNIHILRHAPDFNLRLAFTVTGRRGYEQPVLIALSLNCQKFPDNEKLSNWFRPVQSRKGSIFLQSFYSSSIQNTLYNSHFLTF